MPITTDTIKQILDLARWAPSGDNTQPWRFEIIGPDHIAVHGFDMRRDCVYDFQGFGSQTSLGALLETIAIAASGHSLKAAVDLREGSLEESPIFDVRFLETPGLSPDPLREQIKLRSVQRRPYSARPLTGIEKDALIKSVGPKYKILWIEGLSTKMRMAGLLSHAGKLRLTIPEAYETHRKVIQWNARYSEDKMPDQALGFDRITVFLMRWIMVSWRRVNFLGTFLAGTIIPRIELDVIPALASAAHFVIVAQKAPQSIADYVAGGRALQRFWLTATSLGLQLQPEMTPLIFRKYAANKISLSVRRGAQEEAEKITRELDQLIGNADLGEKAVFMGRIGQAPAALSRSLRLSLERLMR